MNNKEFWIGMSITLVVALLIGMGGFTGYAMVQHRLKSEPKVESTKQSSTPKKKEAEKIKLTNKNKLIALMETSGIDNIGISAEQLAKGKYQSHAVGAEDQSARDVSKITAEPQDVTGAIENMPDKEVQFYVIEPNLDNAGTGLLIEKDQVTLFGAQNTDDYETLMAADNKASVTLTNKQVEKTLADNKALTKQIEDKIDIQEQDDASKTAQAFDDLTQPMQLALLINQAAKSEGATPNLNSQYDVYLGTANEIGIHATDVSDMQKANILITDNHNDTFTYANLTGTSTDDYTWEKGETVSKQTLLKALNADKQNINAIANKVNLATSSEAFPFRDPSSQNSAESNAAANTESNPNTSANPQGSTAANTESKTAAPANPVDQAHYKRMDGAIDAAAKGQVTSDDIINSNDYGHYFNDPKGHNMSKADLESRIEDVKNFYN